MKKRWLNLAWNEIKKFLKNLSDGDSKKKIVSSTSGKGNAIINNVENGHIDNTVNNNSYNSDNFNKERVNKIFKEFYSKAKKAYAKILTYTNDNERYKYNRATELDELINFVQDNRDIPDQVLNSIDQAVEAIKDLEIYKACQIEWLYYYKVNKQTNIDLDKIRETIEEKEDKIYKALENCQTAEGNYLGSINLGSIK